MVKSPPLRDPCFERQIRDSHFTFRRFRIKYLYGTYTPDARWVTAATQANYHEARGCSRFRVLARQAGAEQLMGANGPSSSEGLLTRIREGAYERAADLGPEALTVVGAWTTEYAVRLRPASSPLHLKHVCVETNAIGSCYYERSARLQPEISETLLGRDVLEDPLSGYLEIAALDALYSNIVRPPDDEYELIGTAAEKALRRSNIVCDEVRRLAHEIDREPAAITIANVGVVGDFLEQLVPDGFNLDATDFYDVVRRKRVHGVRVRRGEEHKQCIRDADVAIVTGMTLATDTVDGIIDTALEHNTRLVFFAETGSHFAEVYNEAGVATVVAEPFPFYLSGSDSCKVRIYRQEQSR